MSSANFVPADLQRLGENVVWHPTAVTRSDRQTLSGHRSILLWFTGLSGAGKSTLANAVESHLHRMGVRTYVLDGDNVRHGLCGDLGFLERDRTENIRRIGEVTKLFLDAGVLTLAAFISPFESDRNRIRGLFPAADFLEVYCRCSLATCEQRDVKGLYKKARSGALPNFTGISSRYDVPVAPDLVVDTDQLTLDASVELVLDLLRTNGIREPAC